MTRAQWFQTSAAVFFLGLLLGTTEVRAQATCESLLADNVYNCDVKVETGDTFNDCLRFHSAAPVKSTKFDLSIDLLGDSLGCSCKTTGSFKSPHPDASKEFLCTTSTVPGGGGATWSGKVKANGKISNVQAVFETGVSYIFVCVPDPACVPETARPLDGSSLYGGK